MRRSKTKKRNKRSLLRSAFLPRAPARRAKPAVQSRRLSNVALKAISRQKNKPKNHNRHFSEHYHTGKVLPHHHTSYASLIFITLLLSVFILAFCATAKSATITVTAVVHGPLPPAPAIITSPLDGAKFTDTPITVSGTCSAGFVVSLQRNDVFSGSTLCSITDTFTIQVGLLVGQNSLQARTFNFADQEGPTGNKINVSYSLPIPPTPPTTTPQKIISPLLLESSLQYQGSPPAKEIIWPLKISGGSPPYAISVEWNDGSVDVYSQSKAGAFDVKHTYAHPGSYKGVYIIKIRASDSKDQHAFLQVVALINDVTFKPNITNNSIPLWFSTISRRLTLIWPSFILALLMLLSFIIGKVAGGTLVIRKT